MSGGAALTRTSRVVSHVRAAASAWRTDGLPGVASWAREKLRGRLVEPSAKVGRVKRRVVEFGIQPHLLRSRIVHVAGPAEISYGLDQLLVISVVRNGALHVKSFVEHYQALGVVHCVFLDNGSTDGTLDLLRSYPGVTVLRTDAPYARFENTMKRYLAERFSRGRWNLCADIDELFDYPYSADLPLSRFLGYLNRQRFSAVVAHLLDMFADVPLEQVVSHPDDRVKDKYQYYDISNLDRPPYPWSEPSTPDIRLHWGGIRRTVFGTSNGLSKAAMVLMNGRVKPFVEWHHVTGARVADVSGVLLHYPFVSAFFEKVHDAVRTGRYGRTTTAEYEAYAAALARDPGLTFMRPTARRFEGLEPLIAEGFLTASQRYQQWVRAEAFG
jgi:hypothetical protein